MGCCNKAPNGGSNDIGLLLKIMAVFAVAIFLLIVLFG